MEGVRRCRVLSISMFLAVTLCIMQPVFGSMYNVTTEGGGYLLIAAPDMAFVNESFLIKADYYFLNQLIRTVNTSLTLEKSIIASAVWNTTDENPTLAVNRTEPEKASYTYLYTIAETYETGRIAVTQVPFTVRMISREIEFVNITLYRGIVYNSSETTFEDLSAFEPALLKGQFTYSVGARNSDQVDCILQDTLVLFLPNPRYIGPAECVIKVTYQNASIRYTFKLFVGIASEVKLFVAEHERVIQEKKGLNTTGIQPVLLPVASDENTLETNVVGIKFWALPEELVEGMNGKIVLEVTVRNPDLVENINLVGFLTENKNVTNTTCNATVCRIEYEREFSKAGLQRMFVFTNLVMKRNMSVPHSLGNGWLALHAGGTDLFLSSNTTYVHVKAKQPDLPFSQNGIITTSQDPGMAAAAQGLLREYQKKTRQPLQMENELKNIAAVYQTIVVKKNFEPVVRLDDHGERVMHTIITLHISEKKTPFTTYLWGKKHLKGLVIIEHIPKESAGDLGHVHFNTQGYDIINDDPIVAWMKDDLASPYSISYEVDRLTELQGNTLITGKIKRGFPYGVFLLIIPLLIYLVIRVRGYRDKLQEEAEELAEQAPSYAEIKEDRVLPEEQFEDTAVQEVAKPKSISTMGDFDTLLGNVEEYITLRLKQGDRPEHIQIALVKANWPAEVVEKLLQKQEAILKKK